MLSRAKANVVELLFDFNGKRKCNFPKGSLQRKGTTPPQTASGTLWICTVGRNAIKET